MKKIVAKKTMTDAEAASLQAKYVDETMYTTVIEEDCDGYDVYGNLLFRFRKNLLSEEILELGYNSFKKSIQKTEGRGMASGGYFKRILEDGTLGKRNVSNLVESGNVGYMDARGEPQQNFCRLTQFGKSHFDLFKAGWPFVKEIDRLYSELIPDAYERQKKYAKATNPSYIIDDTSFTTVTVNRSFRTAIHQDAGDLKKGFGNLIVHENGSYTGGYFTMPQYGIAVDVRNTDVLFADVHQWHGNTEMKLVDGFDEIFRVSFVLYYREMMYKCDRPEEQLKNLKQSNGYYKL